MKWRIVTNERERFRIQYKWLWLWFSLRDGNLNPYEFRSYVDANNFAVSYFKPRQGWWPV